MVTEFAPRPHAWRLVSIGIYPWNRAKKRRTKASQYFATLDLIPSNARQECVAIALTICLFSGLRCSLLRSDRAGTNLCWRYACFFPTSEGSAHHLSKQRSGDCQICQTCSASPVREKWMRKRPLNLFKVQSSNFTEKVGLPRPPQPPRFRRPCKKPFSNANGDQLRSHWKARWLDYMSS